MVKYKVQKLIKKAKITIWGWIKSSIKSGKAYKPYHSKKEKQNKTYTETYSTHHGIGGKFQELEKSQ